MLKFIVFKVIKVGDIMRVQRVQTEDKSYPLYILLDEKFNVIENVLRYIKYLDNTGKAPNTIKTYCYHLKLFYDFLEQSKLTLVDINYEELANFVGWLRNPSGFVNVEDLGPKEAKREESTVNSIVNATINYLEFLVRTGDFKELDLFKMQRGKGFKSFLHHINKGQSYRRNTLRLREKQKTVKVLSHEEVKKIIDACHSYRDKFLILLLYEGGLRIGEALSLRLEDVITWDNEIRIFPRDESLNGSYIKNKKERVIHLSKELMGLYTMYLVHEYGDELDHDYVFINLRGPNFEQPLKYQSVADLAKRLSHRTGIDFTLHILRHSHATELINGGWDASYVQKRLGHAHVQTTLQTYVHPSNEIMKREYKKYMALKGSELNESKQKPFVTK